MDKWTYTILDIIFFAPLIIPVLIYRKLILKRWKFILASGLFGFLFFIIDLPATKWGAWQFDYSKTLGPIFGKSVIEELIWTILVCMTVALMIEIFINKSMKEKTIKALKWILGIINKHNIPYQISGGFAAKLYGSSRELNDIDIDIPEESFGLILEEVRPFITYGPDHYVDGKWDNLLMTLKYFDQEIDISGAYKMRISTLKRNDWYYLDNNLNNTNEINYQGMKLKVISPEKLLRYKKELDGDHQLTDIKAIEEYIKIETSSK